MNMSIFKPCPKIFFIGYNKCGTTSFHHFLKSSKINSVHFSYKRRIFLSHRPTKIKSYESVNMALSLEWALQNGKEKECLDHFDAYSDLVFYSGYIYLESMKYFELFHSLYPDAYFVLNDRDMDKWICSRTNHDNGTLMDRAQTYFNLSETKVQSKWREDREDYYEKVFSYFQSSSQFLHFKIDEDPIEKFIDFLSPDFVLDAAHWKHLNSSAQSNERH